MSKEEHIKNVERLAQQVSSLMDGERLGDAIKAVLIYMVEQMRHCKAWRQTATTADMLEASAKHLRKLAKLQRLEAELSSEEDEEDQQVPDEIKDMLLKGLEAAAANLEGEEAERAKKIIAKLRERREVEKAAAKTSEPKAKKTGLDLSNILGESLQNTNVVACEVGDDGELIVKDFNGRKPTAEEQEKLKDVLNALRGLGENKPEGVGDSGKTLH